MKIYNLITIHKIQYIQSIQYIQRIHNKGIMSNVSILGNNEYKHVMLWRYDNERDSRNKLYPLPKERDNAFADIEVFMERLTELNKILDDIGHYKKNDTKHDCLLCDKKNVYKKRYVLNGWIWEDSIIHYMKVHYIEPPVEFKKFVYKHAFDYVEKLVNGSCKSKQSRVNLYKNVLVGNLCKTVSANKKKITLNRIQRNRKQYAVIERNQLLILDALMINGGNVKKYVDPYDKSIKRYSEHAGVLDFEDGVVDKIVVFGSTNRVDDGDDEIFMPQDTDDFIEHEYIFHTHPPTPKPGGRAEEGLLYEFPSIGDILHFIYNYSDGNVIGSLVIAPEGMYNIRKLINDGEEIDVNFNSLNREYNKRMFKLNDIGIDKYGTDFTREEFYSEISQDLKIINGLKKVLEKHGVTYDFYPRIKDGTTWIIDTAFLEM